MAQPAKAVFLGYASQDAEAARRICECAACSKSRRAIGGSSPRSCLSFGPSSYAMSYWRNIAVMPMVRGRKVNARSSRVPDEGVQLLPGQIVQS